MKKILFINAYSARNLGDYAIILGMRNVVNNIFKDCSVKVSSSYHDTNQEIYDSGITSIGSIWNIKSGSLPSKYLKGLFWVLHALFYKKSRKYDYYHESDIVCAVGGGYLYSSRKGPLGIGLLNMLFHIWLGKHFNKKVVCFPQSVGPIHSKIDKWLLRIILKKVDLFISRENMTTNFLRNELKLENVVQNLDIAFALSKTVPYMERESYKDYDILLGVSVLDWRFAKKGSNQIDIEKYLDKISLALNKLSKEKKVFTFIFPQVSVGDGDSDIPISNMLKRKLGSNCEVFQLPEKLEPERLMSTYGQMDVFVGSRMHSTIFALNSGCKTIGLGYQPKTLGTFSMLNIEDQVLDIVDFSSDDLFNKIVQTKNNTLLRESINKELDYLNSQILKLM